MLGPYFELVATMCYMCWLKFFARNLKFHKNFLSLWIICNSYMLDLEYP